MQLRGLASEIVLLNASRQRAEGEAMDINYGSLFTKPVRFRAGDYRHGLTDVALSLPSVINRQGIARTLELPLSNEEDMDLKSSAQVIYEAISFLDEQISMGRIPSARFLLEGKEIT